MLSLFDKILALVRQLYPSGRAFKIPFGSDLEKLHMAITESHVQAYSDAVSIFDSIFPDNANFTIDDAATWETRLGMITNTAVPLPDRMAAIIRKLNAPGVNPAKAHYLYLQDQLQKAGFDVYVYENIFPDYPTGYTTRTPFEVASDVSPIDALSLLTEIQHGDIQHGDAQQGYRYNNIVANHIDEIRDSTFDIGANFRCTFFIGGNPIGSFANVDAARKDEFRQLILKIKPAHTIAYLFIKYI